VNLPKIDKPLTATQLRSRVIEVLALLNGHASKEKTS
jgi:hypothetical protein